MLDSTKSRVPGTVYITIFDCVFLLSQLTSLWPHFDRYFGQNKLILPSLHEWHMVKSHFGFFTSVIPFQLLAALKNSVKDQENYLQGKQYPRWRNNLPLKTPN